MSSQDCCNSMDQMTRILECGHEHILACHIDPKDFKCPTPVRVILPCGHQTTEKPCHHNVNEWKCDLPCDIRVEPCGHSCVRTCHVNDDPDHIQYKCSKCSCITEKCFPSQAIMDKILPDGKHMQDVEYSVTQTIPSCGHQMTTISNCPKLLPCGHLCKNKINQVCTLQCRELVNHTKPVFCGHKFKIECHLQTQQLPHYNNSLLQFCTAPCTEILDCRHNCSGTCGECAQGRIHATCLEKCGVPLICGHECATPCREVCQPCRLKCGLRCCHSKCSKTCGEVCTKCQESCSRRCEHVQCTSKCGDLCSVPPCQEACEKKLPCSHPCVGFCGDPCPTLCRICNAEELMEVFLGHEDAIDARFVLLDECKHVIESRGMEIFCKQDGSNVIGYRRCPKCTTPLTSTQRYSDYIKQAIIDIAAVKEKSGGSPHEIEAKRYELQKKLNAIKLFGQGRVYSISQGFNKFVNECHALLQPVNNDKRQRFDLMIGKTLDAKLTIVQNIGNIFQPQKLNSSSSTVRGVSPTTHEVFSEAITYVEYLFKRLTEQIERITKQEIEDFTRELERLQRIAQFVNIAENSNSPYDHGEIRALIFQPIIYTKRYDEIVKVRLEELQSRMRVIGGITEQERLEIVFAMGLKNGYWYKCPSGHIYAIGECGMAMEVGRCNECGVQIGGRNHSLLRGSFQLTSTVELIRPKPNLVLPS